MNLAVHGLSGDIRQGNTYYEDFHNSFGKFDFVMANPPFNVNGVDNFFYTVTLPCTLWFFDRGKKHTNRKDKVLFIDARSIYRQIDRAHREFTPEQIEFIANIVRLYREEHIETDKGSQKLMEQYFLEGKYCDIPGLCNVATLEEIIDQGYSLNPGRYVGVTEKEEEDFDFSEKLHALNEELERLNAEAYELEVKIAGNVVKILEGRPNE
ncbi:MAG: N-6 DNA methylase [Methanophagales archaeon]|nr:N-6 DNA methylase [Methanophagales archaeon]